METLLFIALAFAGVLIHVGTKFVDALTKKESGVSFGEFFKSYEWGTPLAVSAVSFIIAVVLIVIRDDASTALGFPITKITAVVLGYTADSIWKNYQAKWTTAN